MFGKMGKIAAGLVCAALCGPAGAQSASVPDFTGMWGRNAFNFEAMPTGPKPVTNLRRLKDGTGDPSTLVGDYNNPILKPEAAKIVKERGEISLKGNAYPDPSNHCAPYAPPFNFAMQLGMQMLQTKDHITFIYNQDDQVRRVRLNDRHPAKLTPSAMGDAVGHYEGDTLVVDTVAVATGPLAMMDRYGTPRSEKFHMVERYRLIDYDAAKQAAEKHMKEDGPAGLNGNVQVDQDYKGKGLQVQFTIEDPEILTAPLTATATYRRIKGAWVEQICAENTTEYYAGNKQTAVPTATRPDF
jgi:hypothetical protein